MTKIEIEFPSPLKKLLEDSKLQPHIRDYANRVGDILTDNKLPFFPDYTDHGVDHINHVLLSEVELVPKDVWTNSAKDSDPKLLNAEDAVVLIGSTLLHDIAMHLRPDGFLELVGESTRFQPLPWFKNEQEEHTADRPWRELWLDFQREARRFSDRNLGNIIGLESVRLGWKFDKLPDDTGRWERNHCLIIGEFIRRHHARLAHEIAIYGFPGLDVGSNEEQFPALGEKGNPLQRWADLIGLAARSHGLSLRVCQAYLNKSPIYSEELKPGGSAVFYPMALLRVADYLQIDRQRTPAALLKLRNPQSPISVQEWSKHLAVQGISTSKNNPYSKTITVSPNISLTIYLQLQDLLAGLQAEMDHSTAVLDEAYGRCTDLGLHQLNLATRRIASNLYSSAFRDNLPYVPKRTGFTTDPNLLTLLVEPLYGKKPSVGVRELIQNAVDAVRELHAWCEARSILVESLNLPEQNSDVQIDFIKRDNETWFLRVTDKGIGMSAETIQNYFLRAGASFRQSSEWSKEFLDEQGKPTTLRAGRFGIGAFSIFLLGKKFRLWTRHVNTDTTQGYYLEADGDNLAIEIQRIKKLEVGTVVEIEISKQAADKLELSGNIDGDKWNMLDIITDWFCLDWPVVGRRIIRDMNVDVLAQKYVAPLCKTKLPPEWAVLFPKGFAAVYWTFSDHPQLTCNGIKIDSDSMRIPKNKIDLFDWPDDIQLNKPNVAVFEGSENLPLTIQRYKLSDNHLPFIAELSRDVTLSLIAYAMICGPKSRIDTHFIANKPQPHPLSLMRQKKGYTGEFRWCSSSQSLIIADIWLYSLLQTESCFIFGAIGVHEEELGLWNEVAAILNPFVEDETLAFLSWDSDKNGKNGGSSAKKLGRYLPKAIKDGFLIVQNITEIELLMCCGLTLAFEIFERDNLPYPLQWDKYSDVTPHYDFKGLYPSDYFEIKCHLFQNKMFTNSLPVEDLTKKIQDINAHTHPFRSSWNKSFFFFAKLKTNPNNPQPETQLAKIWNECLGPNPIPFDPIARRELIEKGRQHPELKIHIEKWEEMKRTGSKWVVGSDD